MPMRMSSPLIVTSGTKPSVSEINCATHEEPLDSTRWPMSVFFSLIMILPCINQY